ncbi:hypothetical protein [Rhodococcus sp. AG1013]|uniref:hypothetical protein n=1 Tax=unclassified Rhodococcus (in: high G+C Gram-positive bacteria) TaxID=192944 RepID=UPI000E0B977B|nr:hypothetical protein [Rhodococcus sp. AG1013]RDI20002.1 hypothetical protein DEU38_117114 [Rhodococcus sp. AG1013]
MFKFDYSGGHRSISRRIDAVEKFARPLSRFDGLTRSTLTVSKVPEGRYFEDLSAGEKALMDQVYIQAAGSADAMSVEARLLVGGTYRLYVIGRPGARVGVPTVEIPFHEGRHRLHVYADEVFTADEAAAVFFEWCQTDSVDPDRYQLREFDLNAFYEGNTTGPR